MSSAVLMNVTTRHTIVAVQLVRFVKAEGNDWLRIGRVIGRHVWPSSVQLDPGDDRDLGGDLSDEIFGALLEGRLLDACDSQGQ